MKSRVRFRTTEYALLGVLAQAGPMSGYDAKLYIEASVAQFWGESFGQIYPALERLRRHRLVRSSVDKSSRRERKVFEITDAGKDALAEWLAQTPEFERPRNEWVLKTFLGEHAPRGVIVEHLRALATQMEQQVKGLEEQERQVKTTDAGLKSLPYTLTSIRAGILISRARGEWARESMERLEAEEKKRR